MHEALQPARDPLWSLRHEGYSVVTETAVEFSLCTVKRVSGNARRSRDQPRLDLAQLARLH